jgi:RecQ family ATP-dependent DNA helicase
MDIIFACQKCGQALVIDSAGANLSIVCPTCKQSVTVPSLPVHKKKWQEIQQIVLARDDRRCVACGAICQRGEADVHHLIPRDLGGPDEPSNLVTLCDGCHGAHHPNLQVSLSRRFIERWASRLAKWLDRQGQLPDATPNLGGALRLLGMEKFRENQLDVVLAALNGESVLLVSPTGSGKTLCFQLPTLLRSGTAFVISPLKALMSDQVSGLQKKKIPGSFINSDLGPEEKRQRYELLERQALKFLYCTPERFDPAMVQAEEVQRISSAKPSFLVVDEAHCIDRWGSDFRPNYSRLGSVKQMLGNPPVLAFTATAGVKTQRRILESLEIPDARVVVSGVDRPNIALLRSPIENDEARYEIINWLCGAIPSGRAMIFVPTVKVGQQVQDGLRVVGMDVPFYHSKLGTASERDTLLGRFTGRVSPAAPVIICTNAFGMGLDVPDVRLVVHWQHPGSVEDYLQEFGRAGRDGKQSLAVLFTNDKQDVGLLEYMARVTVEEAELDPEQKEMVLEGKLSQIADMHALATAQHQCFRRGIIRYFQGDKPAPRKPLSLRIVQWLFSAKEKSRRWKHCCDRCDSVTEGNYAIWVRSVFGR